MTERQVKLGQPGEVATDATGVFAFPGVDRKLPRSR